MRVVLVISLILASASAAAVGRIVGGQEASISQYPFMANILHSHDSSFFLSACAGAILNTNSIVTTASCWPNAFGLVRVRVGTSSATSGGTVLRINRVSFPALYNPVTLEQNIAVMNTAEDIIFVPNVAMPVEFASATTVFPDNSLVTIAGWGRTEVGHFSEQLRHAQFRTINNRDCDVQLSPDVFIPYTMMCTTGIGGFSVPDVCVGDNGSPVLLNNVVVGLVSHPGCGYGRPSVHTRVSSFSWILS